MSERIYIDIKEFREGGYLQEVNRQFFHPLGLALAITQHEDGTETLDGIWDSRDDPEGFSFGDLSKPENLDKANHILAEQSKFRTVRENQLGFMVQPIGNVQPTEEP